MQNKIIFSYCYGKACKRQTALIFYNLAIFLRKFTFGPKGDLNSSLDPRGRRQDSWRRGNTSRRHRSWRRGACLSTAGHPRRHSRGRYLDARIHGSEVGATDLGADLGAMYSATTSV